MVPLLKYLLKLRVVARPMTRKYYCLCKISWKLVQNCLRIQRNSFSLVDEFIVKLTIAKCSGSKSIFVFTQILISMRRQHSVVSFQQTKWFPTDRRHWPSDARQFKIHYMNVFNRTCIYVFWTCIDVFWFRMKICSRTGISIFWTCIRFS